MNPSALAFSVVFLASTALANATLISDGFDDTVVDPAVWQISSPFGDSSVSESGGAAIFSNRGRLLSLSNLPTIIEVTGQFTITGNVRDQFGVVIRTDGSATNSFGAFDKGIGFYFHIQNDLGNTSSNVNVVRGDFPNAAVTLASTTFALALNTPYTFRITDDGTNVALYLNDLNTPLLAATDSTVFGTRLGMLNREGAGGGSAISAGSTTRVNYIQVVPEPSAVALIGFAGSLLLTWRKRTRPGVNPRRTSIP
jgi:hypothetical protein